ncbi:aminoglycoside phosphotransferase family protein [Longispora sp. NPDC051575]|uniref:phosphotransferase family protein n=1 Tax=Longispora sp. NPDC051575 TaxID=3154943 RepID=UPI0034233642
MERGFVAKEDLAGLVRAALGPDRTLRAVDRLRGGSKKGVYRLTMDDGSTVVLYVWAPAENYWPAGVEDPTDPFAEASGAELFGAAHARLAAVGVRTPGLRLLDRSREHYPADVALVEDVRGETLEALLDRDPDAAGPTMAKLAAALDRMHGQRETRLGKVALVDAGTAPQDRDCGRVVLDRALRHLDEAAARVEALAAVRDRIAGALRDRAAAVRPRAAHGLVHGELGPDHILVAADGEPVLIDIEGVMWFDVEWEHVFLRLRFGAHHHRWLEVPDLDRDRLRLYDLALELSLVAGPLRLLDGDFPDREFMLHIAGHATRRVLAAVGAA